MGPALSDPRILLDRRRNHGRPHPAGDGAGAPAAGSPAPSISSAPTRFTAATGARSSTTRSCISRSATTRRSTSRSQTSCNGSRPAPRASTSWRAATCPHTTYSAHYHRQSGSAPGGRRLSRARARLCASRRRRACGGRAVPQGFGRTRVRPGERDAELTIQQHLRQDPARRIALLQGL